MRRRIGSVSLVAATLGCVALAWVLCAAGPPGGKPNISELSLEVVALETLYQFRMTPAQMQALRKLAPTTAEPVGARPAAKVSDAYRQTLTELREALIRAEDDEKIYQLQEQLEKLHAAEAPEIDDAFELTDEARRQAPAFLRQLTARQVGAFIALFGDEFPDPGERLQLALDKVRGLGPREWKQFREEVAEEVGRLVAGLDADKAGLLNDRVVQWLIQARALSEDEFRQQRAELEKAARALVGDIGPLEVIRNLLEVALAELLANPRLEAALQARLEEGQ